MPHITAGLCQRISLRRDQSLKRNSSGEKDASCQNDFTGGSVGDSEPATLCAVGDVALSGNTDRLLSSYDETNLRRVLQRLSLDGDFELRIF